MNKLQLVKRLCTESGAHASGPSTTLAQTGEFKRNVDWIDTAYEAIQSEEPQWRFLKDEFEIPLTSGTNEYAASLVSGLAEWHPENWTIHSGDYSDESAMAYVQWEDFRISYRYGTTRTATGKPTVFTITPDNSLLFYPIPDASYTCGGEYFKEPQTMSADDDEPVIPTRYQMSIVWRALMYYGAYHAEADRIVMGQNEYRKILNKMRATELPAPFWGDSLA